MENNIRKVRESQNLSIEDVAAKTNGKMSVRDIEKFESAVFVNVFAVKILARAMNVDRSDLVDYAPGVE